MFLLRLGVKTFPDKSYDKWFFTLMICVSVLMAIFFRDGLRSLVIDLEIRGFMKGWSDKTVSLVASFAPILVALVLLVAVLLFRFYRMQ